MIGSSFLGASMFSVTFNILIKILEGLSTSEFNISHYVEGLNYIIIFEFISSFIEVDDLILIIKSSTKI